MPGNTRQFGPEGDLVLVLQDPTGRDEVTHRFQVSSKHLKLASSVFKAMLSRSFRECIILQDTSTVEIELHDDDAEALAILLSIIHHQARGVTVSPGLLLLVKIAILVDKYDLLEAIGVYGSGPCGRVLASLGAPMADC